MTGVGGVVNPSRNTICQCVACSSHGTAWLSEDSVTFVCQQW